MESFGKSPKPKFPLYANAKSIGSTLWIYVASEKELLTIGRTQQQSSDAQEKTLLQIKGDRLPEGPSFYYSFFKLPSLPSTTTKEEPNSVGIGEDFTTAAQEISSIVYGAIADMIYKKAGTVNFVVICLADISKGIMVKTITHRQDLEKYITGAMPAEEYHGRTILKAKGNTDIIGDKNGKHVLFTDIALENFIIELVNQQTRVEVAKLPEANINTEHVRNSILESFFTLAKAYNFSNYQYVRLQELPSNDTTTVTKIELQKKFGEPSS